MKEILAGDSFGGTMQQAFKDLGIEAKRTYKRTKINTAYDEIYEVWELSDKDFERICNIPDADWKDNWGWWRSSGGSNIEGHTKTQITINNQPILAYVDEYMLDEFEDEDDVRPLSDETLDNIVYGKSDFGDNVLNFPTKDIKYDDLPDYFSRMWGASMEKNVCAIGESLAKLNNITLGELFNKYLG